MRRLFLCLVFLLVPCLSFGAQDHQDQPVPGWYGSISIGAGVLTGTPSQLDARLAARKIDSLDEEAESRTQAIPLARLELGYKIDQGTKVYLKNREGQGLGLALGLGKETAKGQVATEVFYARQDVWKDPYLTGQDREKTTAGDLGAKIRWEEIMHSGFNLTYILTRRFVDDDEAGDRDEDLRRAGCKHALRAGYEFDLGRAGQIEPFVKTEYLNARGASNRYLGYGGGLGYRLSYAKWLFKTKAFFQHRGYSQEHPDFSEKRLEDRWGLSENIIYNQPFGWDDLFCNLRLGYSRIVARQDFFATDLGLFALGIGYRF